jgi:competence protein ComEA
MFLFRLFSITLIALCFIFAGSVSIARSHHSNNRVAASSNSAQPVDINSADVATLETLKGVGSKKAQAIVDYRNKNGAFNSVDDLTSVRGISEKFLAKLEQNNPGMIIAKHMA